MWVAPIEALTITLPANDEVSNAALAQLPVKVIAVDNTLLIVSVTETSILFLLVGETIVLLTAGRCIQGGITLPATCPGEPAHVDKERCRS